MSKYIEFEAAGPASVDDESSNTETRASDEDFIDDRPEIEISTNGKHLREITLHLSLALDSSDAEREKRAVQRLKRSES